MKKLLIVLALSLTFLTGCLGWVHWGGERDGRYNQRQEQRDDRRNNR